MVTDGGRHLTQPIQPVEMVTDEGRHVTRPVEKYEQFGEARKHRLLEESIKGQGSHNPYPLPPLLG